MSEPDTSYPEGVRPMAENHRQRIDEEHVTRSEIAERLAGLRSEVARGEARLRQLDEERVG